MVHVVVVGGGATGVGVARDLALRGVEVTLVERAGIAAGTSGRMHGLLHSGARYAVDDPESARECHRERQILEEIAPNSVTETGGLFVSLPADPDHADRLRAACAEVGIPTETWSGDRAREAEPALSAAVEEAVRVPDGVVDPVRLSLATALDAERAGATVRTGVAVTDLWPDGDGMVVELDDGGELTADHVVNAAGPWAPSVAAMAGVDLPMSPSRGVMVVLDGPEVSRVLNRLRPRNEGDILAPIDGRTVVGTTDRPVAGPEDYPREDEEVATVRESLSSVVPGVANASVVDSYWGVRPLVDPEDESTAASRGFVVRTEGALTSVGGGKLTTHRLMAAVTTDAVCERLGVTAGSETARRRLPDGDDEAIRAAARRWGAASPVPGTPTGE